MIRHININVPQRFRKWGEAVGGAAKLWIYRSVSREVSSYLRTNTLTLDSLFPVPILAPSPAACPLAAAFRLRRGPARRLLPRVLFTIPHELRYSPCRRLTRTVVDKSWRAAAETYQVWRLISIKWSRIKQSAYRPITVYAVKRFSGRVVTRSCEFLLTVRNWAIYAPFSVEATLYDRQKGSILIAIFTVDDIVSSEQGHTAYTILPPRIIFLARGTRRIKCLFLEEEKPWTRVTKKYMAERNGP